MRVAEVRLNAFKGRTGNFPIAPLQVLSGPNGAGKTAILEAIQVALIGHEPRRGPRATAELMSGAVTVAGVVLEDEGRTLVVERTLEESPKGVDRTVRIEPALRDKSAKAAAEWIRKHVGDVASMLDLGEFLNLTAGKRAEYLAALMGSRISGTEALALSDFLAAIFGDCGEQVDDELRKKLTNAWNPRGTLPANLETAIGTIAAAVSEQAARETEAEGGLRTIAGTLGHLQVTSESAADLRSQRLRCQERAESLRTELARDEERCMAIERARVEVQDAERRLKKLQDEEPPLAQALSEAAAVVRDALAKLTAAQQREVPAAVRIAAPEESKRVDAAREALETAKRELRAVEDAVANLRAKSEGFDLGTAECPVASGLRCPAGDSVARAIVKKIAELESIADLRVKRDQASKDHEEALIQQNRRLRELEQLEEKRVIATANREADIREATAKHGRAVEVSTKAKVALERHRQAMSDAQRAAKSAEKAINDLPGALDAADVRRQLDTLRAEIATFDGPEGLIARAEQARALREKKIALEQVQVDAHKRATLYRKLVGAAKRQAGVLLARSLEPLVREVDSVLGRVQSGWKLRVSPEGGGVVLRADTHRALNIAWNVLSGGEAMIFGAALAVGLATLQDQPCRILLIEAAEGDSERVPLLLESLATMAPDFDTIIVATCHVEKLNDRLHSQGWVVTRLGETASARVAS